MVGNKFKVYTEQIFILVINKDFDILNSKYIKNFNKVYIPDNYSINILWKTQMYYSPDIIYKNTYKVYKYGNKDGTVLTIENEEYIKHIKSLLNKSWSGIVNSVLNKALPELHMSLPSNISLENISNRLFYHTKN